MNGDDYRVKLEIFEGPLDLLLHLIRKNEVDIYDIPIAVIVDQYMAYLDLLRSLDLDVAGEFLVMAATLAQIKSRMLLPAGEAGEEEGPDPRAELVERLLEYQRYQEAASELLSRELLGRDVFVRGSALAEIKGAAAAAGIPQVTFAEVGIFALLEALQEVLKRLGDESLHQVIRERVSITEKISELMNRMRDVESIAFDQLFTQVTSRLEVVVIFLALLELIRLRILRAQQNEAFGPIYIARAVTIEDKMLSPDYITGLVSE
ncbi:MAG: hypothetical protein A2V67_12680 [Deltaproteobacteria bacterium RBG_13_61_14]|nr:MAG: hypothetical protein A2V67_12680 [Deltaproteobacteria bacterium RBG_13_61_14]